MLERERDRYTYVAVCLSVYQSIYLSIQPCNCESSVSLLEWGMFYKCCLSAGRRPSPRGFNHSPLPRPPPPINKLINEYKIPSLHHSFFSSEVLMSPGEMGGWLGERKSRTVQMRWSSKALCVWVWTAACQSQWSSVVAAAAGCGMRWVRKDASCTDTQPPEMARGFQSKWRGTWVLPRPPGLLPVNSNIRTFLHRCHTTHLCLMQAVIKKSFRTKANCHAKHSSHFWKPLGTHTLPCGKLHAERGCV